MGTNAFAPSRHLSYHQRWILHAAANNEDTTTTTSSTIATTTTTGTARTSSIIWTEAELLEFASNQGVNITLSTLGPAYRAVARAANHHDDDGDSKSTRFILGYVEGFLRPINSGVLHLDKMEVFRKSVLRARAENPDKFRQGGTVFGVGLLMGYLCLLHGMCVCMCVCSCLHVQYSTYGNGELCVERRALLTHTHTNQRVSGRDHGKKVAEFLAIDDEARQHRKLVRYYERSGFQVIKYVGDGFMDIPDRMIWGGCGTLMRQDIDTLLERWTTMLINTQRKAAETSNV
jgi:hypothetical protein